MALLDWILVVFGFAVASAGSWIQLHPERIYPSQARQPGWPLDPGLLGQIRLLGGCVLFMGAFFVLQMTIDLTRLPWWIGTLSGLVTAFIAVALVSVRARRQQVPPRHFVQQSELPRKVLELR
jgi:hypothetical protein